MKIYWKDKAAYDENGNFLAIIHQLPDAQFYGFLHYPTQEIDFRQYKIKTNSVELSMQQIEGVFKTINDISEIEKVLNTSQNDADLPIQLLNLFAEFAIHRP
jgi:hypothetical protein